MENKTYDYTLPQSKDTEWSIAIAECNFKQRPTEFLYRMYDGTWHYKLDHEGYAYVLYQRINLYVKPLMNIFRIYNKFRKGTAQMGLHYDVPIAHFHDPERFKTFIDILTDKLEDND